MKYTEHWIKHVQAACLHVMYSREDSAEVVPSDRSKPKCLTTAFLYVCNHMTRANLIL